MREARGLQGAWGGGAERGWTSRSRRTAVRCVGGLLSVAGGAGRLGAICEG